MSLADKIQDAKARWARKPQDYYNTPAEATQALLDRTDWKGRPMLVREPCCGEGAISRVLEANGHTVDSSDLEYRGYGRGGVDYLATRDHGDEYQFDAVITNPPFSLAEAFIRRALRDAPFVAMLLPSGFWHAKGRSRLFETRPPQAILALTWRPAFVEERGNSPLMNVMWTVWADADDAQANCTYHTLDRPRHVPELPPVPGTVALGRTGLLGPLQKSLQRFVTATRR